MFEILGNPVPCPRPRVSRFRTYYPQKYTQWREGAKLALKNVPTGHNIEIEYILKRPKRLGKTKTEIHTVKPDIDNLIKATLDSLPFDDKIIHFITAKKRYANHGEQPKTLINIF